MIFILKATLNQYLTMILSPRKSKTDPKQQNILVTYDQKLQPVISQVFTKINQQYAAVHILRTEDDEQNIQKFRKKIKLSKRTIKIIYLEKFNKKIDISKRTYSLWLHYCDGNCNQLQLQDNFPTMEVIQITEKDDSKSIYPIATKIMHLDFTWLGVSGRLGCTISQFAQNIRQFQQFQNVEIVYTQRFLKALNSQLTQQLSMLSTQNPQIFTSKMKEIFDKCEHQIMQKLAEITADVQDWICKYFNQRILIGLVTQHKYYKLLKSRNYFKLIWIEESAIKRYNNFKSVIKDKQEYQNLQRWIQNIQNFLILDDYFYDKFQQRVAHGADFVINTGIVKKPYRQIIQKNYKQIFRKFRPDFDEYFISLCEILKIRGGCIKQAVGSIIVKNKRILSTGYNGTPIGSINCYNGGCEVCNNSNSINTVVLSCNCIHAEYSCIIEAGIESTPGCTLYTTQIPCYWCAKIICQARISTVVYVKNDCHMLEHSNQNKVYQLFKTAQVELRQFSWREKKFSRGAASSQIPK